MQKIICLIVFIYLNVVKAEQIINCLCKVGDLEELEKLNRDYRRIRVEHSNGLNKYLDNQLSFNSYVGCGSAAVYELFSDKNKKKCRSCKTSGWTDIDECKNIRCDREVLNGQPTIQISFSKMASNDQKLFLPGEAIAVFKYSDDKLCKTCGENGEWSKFAEIDLCRELISLKTSKIGCKYESLKQLEYKQLSYVRIRMESSDGTKKFNEKNLIRNELPAGSVVVYQRYLMNLPGQMYRMFSSFKKFKLSTPFTKKFCRYCDDGVWSEIESCVSLNCDKDLLTGSPDLILKSTNKAPSDEQSLFKPFSVVVMSKFGDDKFCKQCHENGEWSKYSLAELCEPQADDIIFKPRNPENMKSKYLEEMYKKESSCEISHLDEIEENHKNIEKVFYVSFDRKTKLELSNEDFNLPSRTLSLYHSSSKSETKRYCSICINGIWSNITSECTSDNLYYCERDKLSVSGSFIVDFENQASISQNLFEPGKVMVYYDISETTRLCKICKNMGEYAEWSRYAETSLCDIEIAFKNLYKKKTTAENSCQLKELNDAETDEFIRENIQSPDAKILVDSESFNENSIAVYHRNSLSNIKYCLRCINGKWENNHQVCPLFISVKKCDPTKLRGANYFVYTEDGTQLDENEQKFMIFPNKVAAVYIFGAQKYCKMCNSDGNWSSYPQFQICENINWKKDRAILGNF